MTDLPISRLAGEQLSEKAALLAFFMDSSWARRRGEPGISDFVAGNPHEMPLPEFHEALRRHSIPQRPDWYAYKVSEPEACAVVAKSLRERYGVPFEAEDVFMTNGAFGGLAVAVRAVVDPGDEVVFITPCWFFYDTMIRAAGGTPVRVPVRPPHFDLDLSAVAAALTPRTRALVVNSPHNPTGRLYSQETAEGLARLLNDHSERHGRRVYLISDESYSRIVYDGRTFITPTASYPASFLVYTYGKTLLTPGQRLGYLAVPPSMPDRSAVRGAIFLSQIATGWAFPNALLQHALPDLEPLSIDVAHLQRKRDRMVEALRGYGYELQSPEGTFYLLPRSPIPDDAAFTERLAERDVFVLPGALLELPGYFRISLTASDEMIERALPEFAAAINEAVPA